MSFYECTKKKKKKGKKKELLNTLFKNDHIGLSP